MKKKCKVLVVLVCVFMLLLCGCSLKKISDTEGEKLEFTILSKEVTPTEVLNEMEKKNGEAFSFSYAQGEYLYICVGYGPQKGQDYSISVERCELMEDGIHVNTTLLGPSASERRAPGISYPYIVIRTEYVDAPIVIE